MKKKTIVLGNNGSYDLANEIIKNLEFLGFNVIFITINNSFSYDNFLQKIVNYFLKKFFDNKEIEKKLKIKPFLNEFYKKVDDVGGKVDYALFIRTDDFPITFLKKIKSKSNLMIAYQWDGLHLFPEALKRIKYFDRFFVFDPSDLKLNYRIDPTTNFYFDYNLELIQEIEDAKSVYFFGTYINHRMDIIAKLSQKIKSIGFDPNINIVVSSRDKIDKYRNSEIEFLEERISFEENIRNAQKSAILVDFVNGKHNGLSFRTFDAIGYQKKLITTNSEVKNYDFYHPNNFFILNENNLDDLEEFLFKPYVKLDIKIREKYSFTNWICYVLNIEPYYKIDLPNK